MQKKYLPYIILIIFFLTSSCQKDKVNFEEYTAMLNNPENGLVYSKTINGIKLQIKYLPLDYLHYKEFKTLATCGKNCHDSILNKYQKSLTFLISFAPDENHNNGDVMYTGLKNYSEYVERVLTMNFEISDAIKLNTSEGQITPVLSNMENTYGLAKNRTIMIVFEKPETTASKSTYNEEEFELIYSDKLFNLGINHFIFKVEDINKMPKLII